MLTSMMKKACGWQVWRWWEEPSGRWLLVDSACRLIIWACWTSQNSTPSFKDIPSDIPQVCTLLWKFVTGDSLFVFFLHSVLSFLGSSESSSGHALEVSLIWVCTSELPYNWHVGHWCQIKLFAEVLGLMSLFASLYTLEKEILSWGSAFCELIAQHSIHRPLALFTRSLILGASLIWIKWF